MQNFITSFITGILSVIVFSLVPMLLFSLGVPASVANAIAWILLLEVVLKSILLKVVPPFVAEITSLSAQKLNLDRQLFDYYCSELEAIGFQELVDYTSPNVKGMARLYCHREHNCYAEVGLLSGFSAYCSLVCGFERGWFFAATTNNPSTNIKAISFAFLSLPKTVCKIFNEEPRMLLKSFLSWQEKIKHNLSVEIIAITDEQMYFAWERAKRQQQRRRLMRKSITVCLIKLLLFHLNPKSEWLGDYQQISARSM